MSGKLSGKVAVVTGSGGSISGGIQIDAWSAAAIDALFSAVDPMEQGTGRSTRRWAAR